MALNSLSPIDFNPQPMSAYLRIKPATDQRDDTLKGVLGQFAHFVVAAILDRMRHKHAIGMEANRLTLGASRGHKDF